MKKKTSAIFAILLIMSLALSMSAFATLDGQGGILPPKADHACSFEHKDCVKSAPLRIGFKSFPHCAYGNIVTTTTFGPWVATVTTCIHGAVGIPDYLNTRSRTVIERCTGCQYTKTYYDTEGPIRTCGYPM